MIEVIPNILPKDINKIIIDNLIYSTNWQIGKDNNMSIEKCRNYLLSNESKDFGIFQITYDAWHNINIDSSLNLYGNIIFKIIEEKTKQYKFKKLCRIFWNYYNNSSKGSSHQDMVDKNYVSFVYSLNDNEGGTFINNEFIQSKNGQAVLFPSHLLHYGTNPKNSVGRFNLNCIIEI
jgi:hypothetical protein